MKTARLIKQDTLKGGPPVVALSHQDNAISRLRALFAGCDAFLPVPLDESTLQQLLARHDMTFERVFEATAIMPA